MLCRSRQTSSQKSNLSSNSVESCLYFAVPQVQPRVQARLPKAKRQWSADQVQQRHSKMAKVTTPMCGLHQTRFHLNPFDESQLSNAASTCPHGPGSRAMMRALPRLSPSRGESQMRTIATAQALPRQTHFTLVTFIQEACRRWCRELSPQGHLQQTVHPKSGQPTWRQRSCRRWWQRQQGQKRLRTPLARGEEEGQRPYGPARQAQVLGGVHGGCGQGPH